MTEISRTLKRLFPTLAAMPAEELMVLPLIVFMFIGLFTGALTLLFAA